MTVSRDIQLKVIADAAGFQKEIMKIPGMTEKSAAAASLRMSKEMHKGFKKVGKDAETAGKKTGAGISKGMKAGLATAAVAASALVVGALRGIPEAISRAADVQNELSDLAAETGLSVDQLALLRLGASSAGKEMSALEGAIRPLAKKIGDFTMGTGEAKVGLERLGFTVDDFSGSDGSMVSAGSAFDMITDRLMRMESESDRADTAMRIFGEGAGHLINVLTVAGGATSALAKFQKTLGLNTDAARASAAEYQQTVAVVNETLKVMGQTLLVELTPVFEMFAVGMIHAIEPMRVLVSTVDDLVKTQTDLGVKIAHPIFQLQAASQTIGILSGAYEEWGATAGTTEERVAALRDVFSQLREGVSQSTTAIVENNEATGQTGGAAKNEAADKARAAALAKDIASVEGTIVKLQQEQMLEGDKLYDVYERQLDELHDMKSAHKDNAKIAAVTERAAALLTIQYNEQTEALERQAKIDLAGDVFGLASEAATVFSDAAGLALDVASDKATRYADTLERLKEKYQELDAELSEVNDKEFQRLQFHAERTDLTDAMIGKISKLAAEERSAIKQEMRLNRDAQKQKRKDAQKEAKLARKMFRVQQAAAVGQTLINSGEAAIAVAAQFPPPNPLYAVGMGIVAGTLATSLAQIRSQKAPSFHSGGMIQADERMIRARQGEAVLNERATQRLGESTITGLNEGRMMAPITVNVQVGRRQLERVVIDAMNSQAVEAVGTINPYATR